MLYNYYALLWKQGKDQSEVVSSSLSFIQSPNAMQECYSQEVMHMPILSSSPLFHHLIYNYPPIYCSSFPPFRSKIL
jgi:hypothetical protein